MFTIYQMSHLVLIACVAIVGAVVFHIPCAPLSANIFAYVVLLVVTLAAIGASIYFFQQGQQTIRRHDEQEQDTIRRHDEQEAARAAIQATSNEAENDHPHAS